MAIPTEEELYEKARDLARRRYGWLDDDTEQSRDILERVFSELWHESRGEELCSAAAAAAFKVAAETAGKAAGKAVAEKAAKTAAVTVGAPLVSTGVGWLMSIFR